MHGMRACECLWMHVDASLMHVDACMLVEESVACMHLHSWYIFEALSMDYDRLSEPVTTWNMSSSFQEMESIVKIVKVENDAAEKGDKASF